MCVCTGDAKRLRKEHVNQEIVEIMDSNHQHDNDYMYMIVSAVFIILIACTYV